MLEFYIIARDEAVFWPHTLVGQSFVMRGMPHQEANVAYRALGCTSRQ
jgi:hypothetical protein